ncbi:MAG TPA: hypothetical protein VF701_09040 [Thermoanaerobaculia bacterium]
MNRYTFALMTTLAFCLVLPAVAGDSPAEGSGMVQQQIRKALLAEQEAFAAGGCAGVLAFFGDREPLFVSSGRSLRSLAAMRAHCGERPARWAGVDRRELLRHTVHATSPSTGYTVSHYRMPAADGKGGSEQIITKIWGKERAGGGLFTHTSQLVPLHRALEESGQAVQQPRARSAQLEGPNDVSAADRPPRGVLRRGFDALLESRYR